MLIRFLHSVATAEQVHGDENFCRTGHGLDLGWLKCAFKGLPRPIFVRNS